MQGRKGRVGGGGGDWGQQTGKAVHQSGPPAGQPPICGWPGAGRRRARQIDISSQEAMEQEGGWRGCTRGVEAGKGAETEEEGARARRCVCWVCGRARHARRSPVQRQALEKNPGGMKEQRRAVNIRSVGQPRLAGRGGGGVLGWWARLLPACVHVCAQGDAAGGAAPRRAATQPAFSAGKTLSASRNSRRTR